MKRWLTFLRNHREAIVAMDFFTVPTLTFGILYCFFVIGPDRRRILHHNVTRNPNALWVALQPARNLGMGRASASFSDLRSRLEIWFRCRFDCERNRLPASTYGIPQSWQNGIAERWVGSVRRELLDHVIVLNQRHRRRLLEDYVRYYHEDRTHLALGKDTPSGRALDSTSPSGHEVISLPRLGGLHHRYAVAA